jgi:hypothetical protein
MAKAKDFSADLAVLDSTVRGEVDTILKLVREKEKTEKGTTEEAPAEIATATANSSDAVNATTLSPDRDENVPKKARRTATRATSNSGVREQVVLENVTTRLSRQTNELLTEAALRQKLKKESPSTRQDVIEVALQEWFRKNGYRSGDSNDE